MYRVVRLQIPKNEMCEEMKLGQQKQFECLTRQICIFCVNAISLNDLALAFK